MSETSEIVAPTIAALNKIPGVVAYRIFTGSLAYFGRYISGARKGFPDIGAVIAGRAIFFEAKTETGKVSNEQERLHDRLQRAGARVHVIRSVADALHIAKDALGAGP
jgi:hypothetical protein